MAKKTKDIDNLNERIYSFKNKRAKQQRQISAEEKVFSRAGAGIQISVELLSGVLLGAAIGYFLDRFFNVGPWLLALFTIFGGGAGVLNIYRTFKDNAQKIRSK